MSSSVHRGQKRAPRVEGEAVEDHTRDSDTESVSVQAKKPRKAGDKSAATKPRLTDETVAEVGTAPAVVDNEQHGELSAVVAQPAPEDPVAAPGCVAADASAAGGGVQVTTQGAAAQLPVASDCSPARAALLKDLGKLGKLIVTTSLAENVELVSGAGRRKIVCPDQYVPGRDDEGRDIFDGSDPDHPAFKLVMGKFCALGTLPGTCVFRGIWGGCALGPKGEKQFDQINGDCAPNVVLELLEEDVPLIMALSQGCKDLFEHALGSRGFLVSNKAGSNNLKSIMSKLGRSVKGEPLDPATASVLFNAAYKMPIWQDERDGKWKMAAKVNFRKAVEVKEDQLAQYKGRTFTATRVDDNGKEVEFTARHWSTDLTLKDRDGYDTDYLIVAETDATGMTVERELSYYTPWQINSGSVVLFAMQNRYYVSDTEVVHHVMLDKVLAEVGPPRPKGSSVDHVNQVLEARGIQLLGKRPAALRAAVPVVVHDASGMPSKGSEDGHGNAGIDAEDI